jgi:nitric oxide reductase NorQ protein
VLYWDEPNATPDGIRFWLFSLMDGRREITLPDNNGEVIRAGANFTVIGAMNEGKGYTGTSRLNDAQRERFAVIDLGYLPAARERKLLVQRTGCSEDIADKLVSLGKQLRASFERSEVHTPFGTRTLLKAAKLIVQGVKPIDATKVAFVNAIPATNAPERKAVATATAAFFGKNVATEATTEAAK